MTCCAHKLTSGATSQSFSADSFGYQSIQLNRALQCLHAFPRVYIVVCILQFAHEFPLVCWLVLNFAQQVFIEYFIGQLIGMHAVAHWLLIFQRITTMCSSSQIKCHIKSQAGAIGIKAVEQHKQE